MVSHSPRLFFLLRKGTNAVVIRPIVRRLQESDFVVSFKDIPTGNTVTAEQRAPVGIRRLLERERLFILFICVWTVRCIIIINSYGCVCVLKIAVS